MVEITTSPRLALFTIASVGILALQLLSDDGIDHASMRSLSTDNSPMPKINLNAPYAPYKGIVEPQFQLKTIDYVDEDHNRRQLELEGNDSRQLARYAVNRHGEVRCFLHRTRGPAAIPEDVVYENTVIAGYPGADKRVVLRQMEMMTRLSGRDSWDFEFLGMTKQPYIKTNYPHHEGVWGWQDHADQVMLVVRNIRSTIDEYHDILADIDYAKTWMEATDKIPRLYRGTIDEEKYVRWRDERTMDEIGWYGWLIDYWMEGGILRDYYDHKLTTKEHWAKLRQPETYTYGELQWDVNICETDPAPPVAYDDVCDPEVTANCMAKVVISAERLYDPATGRVENRKIGTLLNATAGIRDELLGEQGWDCLYDKLIGDNPNGTAPENTDGFDDWRAREGVADRKHVVSTRHLNKMVQQVTRLITKYGAYDPETDIDWTVSEPAQDLVEVLTEHRVELQAELDATNVAQVWAHPPKPNWVVFPKCATEGRRVWDFNYPHEYSGSVLDMFAGVA